MILLWPCLAAAQAEAPKTGPSLPAGKQAICKQIPTRILEVAHFGFLDRDPAGTPILQAQPRVKKRVSVAFGKLHSNCAHPMRQKLNKSNNVITEKHIGPFMADTNLNMTNLLAKP